MLQDLQIRHALFDEAQGGVQFGATGAGGRLFLSGQRGQLLLQLCHAHAAGSNVDADVPPFLHHQGMHLVVFPHALLLGGLGLAHVHHQLVDLLVGGAVALHQLPLGGLELVDQWADYRHL